MKNNAFTLVKHTESKPIGCKWAYMLHSDIERIKSAPVETSAEEPEEKGAECGRTLLRSQPLGSELQAQRV